jgi:hypothetical protein
MGVTELGILQCVGKVKGFDFFLELFEDNIDVGVDIDGREVRREF